ncbi:MAG TPA: PilC/PilY family type IV pilus protein, partial [Rhodocyclaceae bacterium]|nr:PilC/PilY family type IV pilus protein [Rhodocyclaceae bacterium]
HITSFDTSGNAISSVTWSARDQITAQNWDTGRSIVTFANGAAAPFRYNKLTTTEQATLGSTAADQQNVLNYLRGDKSNEGSKYRTRKYLLGDIVASQPAIVGSPAAEYIDDFNPGYSAFKTAKASRNTMVYVGANDGMMHALDDTTGKEVWAYVPSYLFEGSYIEAAGVDEIDGLAELSQTFYNHRYYVNSTTNFRDVDFARTANASGALPTVLPTVSDWHTLLVGGLGKGGKIYYGLDITTPVSMGDSETTIVSNNKVLWEFTDPDLGYTYGQPLIVKTVRWGWVVVFSSGYNNTDGKGYIFVVNPQTGKLLAKASTTLGDTTNQSGMTELTAFVKVRADFTVKEIYGGDLLGNVWRFSLADDGTITVVNLANLKNGTNIQPVTAAPWVDIAKDGKRYLMVGTGRALDISDVYPTPNDASQVSNQTQTVYAIRDGNIDQPFFNSTLPSGVSFPITRSNMVTVADLTVGAPFSSNANNVGWYFDLPNGTVGNGKERVIQNFAFSDGIIAWLGQTPNGANACVADWTSHTYAVNMSTGVSILRDSSGAMISSLADTGVSRGLAFIRIAGGLALAGTDSGGGFTLQQGTLPSGSTPTMVNWRTIGE